jgi:hypothetical protein
MRKRVNGLKSIIYEKLEYVWDDCSCMIKCPECGRDLVVDSQNGWENCDCGLEYRLSTTIEFRK